MGWRIRVRSDEACASPQPFLSPDLVLTQNIGPELHFDMALADPIETQNRMGLRAREGLHTAIIIQLFTDRRRRDDQVPLDYRSPDKRGWWGDSVDVRFDLGETELGSHLWLLRRAPLTQETLDLAADYCHEALQTIVDQGAVARFDIRTEALNWQTGGMSTGVLGIMVDGFSFDGSKRYSQHFDVLWDQIENLARAA